MNQSGFMVVFFGFNVLPPHGVKHRPVTLSNAVAVHERLGIGRDSLGVHQPFGKHQRSFVLAALVAKITQHRHHRVSRQVGQMLAHAAVEGPRPLVHPVQDCHSILLRRKFN